LEGDFRI